MSGNDKEKDGQTAGGISIPLTARQNKILADAFKKAGLKITDDGLAVSVERDNPSVGWEAFLARLDSV